MAEIKVLSQDVADKIAAGEVVERPAAVVKELVENSIDAGADRITVEIKNGGIKYISIEDNGKGIKAEELEYAFLRHATSKIRDIDDLFEISTMGFRGEALASICAVAEVNVVSRTSDSDTGACMSVKHGKASEKAELACNVGTVMVVENLFANVPARMKFLKKDSTEAGYITDIVSRIALSKPEIAFRYIIDGKEEFSTSGDGSLRNAILNIYGIDHAKGVYDVDYTEHGVRVFGCIGKAELSRGNRTRQTLFVNGRYIKNHVIAKVIEEAYRNVLMTGKFPFFVLNIDLAPQLVDVNVHPAKTEIKLANEKEVYNIVHCAVKNALYDSKKETNIAEPQKRVVISERPVEGFQTTFKESIDRRIVREFMERTTPTEKDRFVFREKSLTESLPEEKIKIDQEKEGQTFQLFDNKTETDEPERVAISEATGTEVEADITDIAGNVLNKAENISDIRVVGQIFNTYIIAQQGADMMLIDQHAAHERRRFEMLKRDYISKQNCGQQLLTPIVFDVDALEMQIVKENRQLLEDMGFLMEEFGRGSIIIRETPLIGDEDEIKSLATEVISTLAENRPIGVLSREEQILDMISCKYAIKANKKLSLFEMEALVQDVLAMEADGITTCPHGRPIKVVYSKRDLEKSFKRIV